jgi:hypothetical protein
MLSYAAKAIVGLIADKNDYFEVLFSFCSSNAAKIDAC